MERIGFQENNDSFYSNDSLFFSRHRDYNNVTNAHPKSITLKMRFIRLYDNIIAVSESSLFLLEPAERRQKGDYDVS